MEIDAIAGRELELYAENNASLYKQRFLPIIANVKRKLKSGKYDHDKAWKLWLYWVDDAANRYAKELGSPGDTGKKMFDKSTREYLAHKAADNYLEAINAGEYN